MQHNTTQNPAYSQGDKTSPSVIIVGAGPTGLAAANLLGMAGIQTLVLERNATLSDCPKAISIDDEGLRVCQAMGLRDAVIEHVVLDIEAHYVSAQHLFAKVSPTSRRNGFPLISTFHQPAFEATLLQGLDRFPCVKVCFQHTVETFVQEQEKVTLTVSTPDDTHYTLDCDYLLACDGGKSPIRHLLGIPMYSPTLLPRRRKHNKREDDSRQRWLVVDTINDDDVSTAATFFCEYRRPAVSVPAPHHARRWEFMLLRGERDEDLMADDTIHKFIRQARASHPHIHPAIQHSKPIIIRKTIYAFRSVIAQRFMQGRVFLLGDAAHLMPPFGGQGMNSGLRDAHNLCWKLRLVLQEQAHPRLLETYHVERYPHVKEMILFSSLLGNVVMTTTRMGAWFRNRFFAFVNALPPLREAITEMRVKPQPRYKRGFLLPIPFNVQMETRAPARGRPSHTRIPPKRTVIWEGRPLAGALAQFKRLSQHNIHTKLIGAFLPQPYVLTQEGKRVLFDDVLGNGFVLLRLYEKPEQAFEDAQGEQWQRLGVKRVCVMPQGVTGEVMKVEGCEVVSDVDGRLGDFLRHRQGILLVLVRPDRYVAGVFEVGDIFETAILQPIRKERERKTL